MLIYPKAEYDPAPPNKTWGAANARAGVILHSMVGGWGSARARLMGPEQASWHYSVLKDGRVLAHYELDASPWHGGSYQNNLKLIGIEHEGGAPGNFSEPLTEPQLAASIGLVEWIASQCGWTPSRSENKTLFEHSEVHATQCPSGRIPWDYYIPEPAPIGPNVQFNFRGWNAETQRFEYTADVYQHWEGAPVGPNVETVYEGYDETTFNHRFRFGIGKHW